MFLPLAMFGNSNPTKQNGEQEKGTAAQGKLQKHCSLRCHVKKK